MKPMKTPQEIVEKLLMIIPYLASARNPVSEETLMNIFNLEKSDIHELFNIGMMIGYPPYSPETYFDLYIDESDGLVKIYCPKKGLFESPVNFTLDEVFALIIAIQMINKMVKITGLEGITEKIRDILRSNLKLEIDTLQEKIELSGDNPAIKELIETIKKAIEEKKLIELDYYALSSNSFSTRIVEPYLNINHFGNLYLLGFCRLRNDYRRFRYDRIKQITILDKKFTPRTDFRVEDYLSAAHFYFNSFPAQTSVTLRFKKVIAQEAREKFYWAETSTLRSGDILVKLPLYNREWILRQVKQYGSNVKIISPPDLKTSLINEYESILNQYSDCTC